VIRLFLATLALFFITALPAAAEGQGYRLVTIRASGAERGTLIRNQQVRIFDFSPRRQRIVFTRPASGLYVSGLNGKDSELILRLAGATVQDAAWSPDGRRLALTIFGKLPQDLATCGISVWTVRIDGVSFGRLPTARRSRSIRRRSLRLGLATVAASSFSATSPEQRERAASSHSPRSMVATPLRSARSLESMT